MSKAVITISVNKKLKEDFAKYAEEMGTNMSNLLSMFMASSLKNKNITFYGKRGNFELVEPTEEEKKIIEEYQRERDNGTLEVIDGETLFKELGFIK